LSFDSQPFLQIAPTLRLQFLNQVIVPVVWQRLCFESESCSALMSLAQFWNDEAFDQIHWELAFSQHSSGFDGSQTAKKGSSPLLLANSGIDNDVGAKYFRNGNGLEISAFSAFSNGMCFEEVENETEVYTDYARFYKQGNRLHLQVIGAKVRPWLEGVRPSQWDKYAYLTEPQELFPQGRGFPDTLTDWYRVFSQKLDFPFVLSLNRQKSEWLKVSMAGLMPLETCLNAGKILFESENQSVSLDIDTKLLSEVDDFELADFQENLFMAYQCWDWEEQLLAKTPVIPDFSDGSFELS